MKSLSLVKLVTVGISVRCKNMVREINLPPFQLIFADLPTTAT